MLRNKRMMSAMYITLILIIFLGCEKSDGERHEKFPKYTSLKYTPLKYTSKYTSFRDIPGITEDEIKAIEALRKQYVSFVYGITPSTEAFNKNSGGIGGFSALFCEWLTRLFEIPFKPTVYEWGDLLQKLHAGEVDFSGDISPTDERRNIYFMTETIALRTLKYIRIKGSTQLSEIAKVRPLQLVFFEGATTYNHVVSSDAYDTFKAHFVKNKEAAYDLLKSRKADALIAESVVEADFDVYGDVVTSDFFPLVYSSVSLATQNPALKPIISIVQKALENEGLHYLSELYSKGYREYMKHKLFMRLSDEEIAYINTHSLIPFAVEYDNYPVSFYNTRYKEWQGISIDVLREVEALTGLNFVVAHDQNTKWPELLKMLEDGKVFMISELIRSKDREGRFLWPKSSLLTDHSALVSKTDYRNISINDVLSVKVGLSKGTAHAELFQRWFQNHKYAIIYDRQEDSHAALIRGDVDMVMSSYNSLLFLTNYLELPGYKANIVFDNNFQSTFGFNKDEVVLCSIVDKALELIDTEALSGNWMRKTYDYRLKVAQAQRPWLIGTAVLLLCVLILLLILYLKNRNMERRLEGLVRKRTTYLKKQLALMSVVNNSAVSLLESDAENYLDALNRSMEFVCRHMETDCIYLWQNNRKEDGKLYYKQICKWAKEELRLDTNLLEFAYHDTLPKWEELFSRGESINVSLDMLPERERSFLQAYQIHSLLAVPLFLKGVFWGFVSCDDCYKRRVFPKAEEQALQSWGWLAMGVIQREQIKGMKEKQGGEA